MKYTFDYYIDKLHFQICIFENLSNSMKPFELSKKVLIENRGGKTPRDIQKHKSKENDPAKNEKKKYRTRTANNKINNNLACVKSELKNVSLKQDDLAN